MRSSALSLALMLALIALATACKGAPAPRKPASPASQEGATTAELVAAMASAREEIARGAEAPSRKAKLTNMVVQQLALPAASTRGAAGGIAAAAAVSMPVPTPKRIRRAVGGKAAVATAHPLATKAAMDALAAGGTAVDALVAATFMLTVVTPQSTGIGGGGFAIVWPGAAASSGRRGAAKASAKPIALDFREQAPAAGRRAQYLDAKGHAVAKRSQRHGLAVGVPGTVAGLWALHQRWGKRPWASLVKPAMEVAKRGFVMGDVLVDAAQATWPELHVTAKLVLSRNSTPPKRGAILRQPALARTLRSIGLRGPKGFYEGGVAYDMVKAVQATGGHLSLADLRDYKPRWRTPLSGEALGMRVLTMPQPSAGGAQLLAMAELMDHFSKGSAPKRGAKLKLAAARPGALDPAHTRFREGDAGAAHALAEAMRRAFQLRLAYSGDAAKPAVTLGDVYPKAVRASLAKTYNPARATVSARLPRGKLERHENTSHVSIIDSSGMAVSSTHTVNLLFGSGIVARRSGVWLNNELDDFSFTLKDSNYFGLAGSQANLFRPGARPVSSMTPSIFLKDGKPALIVGSPGGTRIPTAVFLVAWRTLIAGQPLLSAVDAPRLHQQAFPDEVWVEAGQGERLWRRDLEAKGHRVVAKPAWCDVQAIRVTRSKAGNSALEAVSDGRGEGSAAAR